jgi:hypothetical protein
MDGTGTAVISFEQITLHSCLVLVSCAEMDNKVVLIKLTTYW